MELLAVILLLWLFIGWAKQKYLHENSETISQKMGRLADPSKKQKKVVTIVKFDTSNVTKKIQTAIYENTDLRIVYTNNKGKCSHRTVTPISLGPRDFDGYVFNCLKGYCHTRKEIRHFNINRITKISKI